MRQNGFQVLIGALTSGNGNTMSSIAGLAAILRFSREAEAEADDFALAALAASEIDPMGLKRFFEVVLKEEGKHRAGTFSKIEPAFSTHPGTEERIKKIAPLPAGATSRPALSGEQWQALQKICGP